MNPIRVLKGLLGICQAKGCLEPYAFCVDMKSEGKKIGSAKLCEKHTIAILEAKDAEDVERDG